MGRIKKQTELLQRLEDLGVNAVRLRIGQHHNRLNRNHDKSTQQGSDGPGTVLTFVVTIAAHKTSKACVIHRNFSFTGELFPKQRSQGLGGRLLTLTLKIKGGSNSPLQHFYLKHRTNPARPEEDFSLENF